MLFPLLALLRGDGSIPLAVILVPTIDEVGSFARAHARLSRSVRDAPSFVPLGEIEDVRREQRRLSKGCVIVAGTVERVIDHIRRGSLRVESLRVVLIEAPEGEILEDFTKDIQFIFARLSNRPQVVLCGRSPAVGTGDLASLLHRPVSIGAQDLGPAGAADRGLIFFETGSREKQELLVRVLLARRIPSALVLHSPRADGEKIAGALRRCGLRADVLHGAGRRRGAAARPLSALDALVVAFSATAATRAELEEYRASTTVYFDLPPGGGRLAETARAGSGAIALVESGQERELTKLQEAVGAAMKKEEIPDDEATLAGTIDRILERVKEEKGSGELAALRARIRRKVPLLLRPWFSAYLLKSRLPEPLGHTPPVARPFGSGAARLAGAQPGPQEQRGRSGRFGEGQRAPAAGPPPAGRGGFTQLFVSIGRNRRVFARDLTEHFTAKLNLGAGEIANVRVFDKYSFIDIAQNRAGEAIEKLSGSELKGRAITVNYAKKKEEKEGR
jgi:ATP-dependent RNA helicase DeaD